MKYLISKHGFNTVLFFIVSLLVYFLVFHLFFDLFMFLFWMIGVGYIPKPNHLEYEYTSIGVGIILSAIIYFLKGKYIRMIALSGVTGFVWINFSKIFLAFSSDVSIFLYVLCNVILVCISVSFRNFFGVLCGSIGIFISLICFHSIYEDFTILMPILGVLGLMGILFAFSLLRRGKVDLLT